MTSKIVVNNIESDTGVSTVTIASPVALSGGITGTGFAVGTGASISSPATNVLTLGTNNTESVRINSTGVGIGTNNPASTLDVGGEITIRRTAAGNEGGQINFARASDNAVAWNIDAYGSTSTPSLRFIDSITAVTRMEIDGSGRVTMPYQPAFRASFDGDNTTLTSAGRMPYTINAGFGCFDKTNSYDNTNYYFVAPAAGTYIFGAGTYTNLNTDSMWDIRVNGTIVQRAEWRQSGGDDIGDNSIHHVTVIVQLAVNDQVDVYWSSGQVQIIGNFTSFHGAKIS